MKHNYLFIRNRFCRAIVSLLLALFVLEPAGTANRGLTVSVESADGETISLYSESHALLIGISDYQQWPILESVPSELAMVENTLVDRGFTVEKHLNLSGDQLENVFDDFIDNYGFASDNQLLFYFSGHGWTHPDGKKGYLVPSDAPSPTKDRTGFLRTALPMTQVLAWARQAEAKHALFLFDSCFSGTIFQTKALPKDPPHITNATALPVRQFITAGSAGEVVPAKSVFTPAFVDAMTYGYGDLNEDGYVSGTELGLYLQNKVPQHSNQHPQFGKIQDFDLSRGDFIFVLPTAEASEKQEKVASLAPVTTSSSTVGVALSDDLAEVAFWDTVKDSDEPEMIEAYLEQFPEGTFLRLAMLKLKNLEELVLEKKAGVVEASFWDSVKDSDDPEMFEAYLAKYPNGEFVVLAKIKLDKLEPPVEKTITKEDTAAEVKTEDEKEITPTPETETKVTLTKKEGDACPEGKIQTYKGCIDIATAETEATKAQIKAERRSEALALAKNIAMVAAKAAEAEEAKRKATATAAEASAEAPTESADDELADTGSSGGGQTGFYKDGIDLRTGHKIGEDPNKTPQQNAMDKHRQDIRNAAPDEAMDKHREWTKLCQEDPEHDKCKQAESKGGDGDGAGAGGGGGSTWYCRYRYWNGYYWGPWGPWEPC